MIKQKNIINEIEFLETYIKEEYEKGDLPDVVYEKLTASYDEALSLIIGSSMNDKVADINEEFPLGFYSVNIQKKNEELILHMQKVQDMIKQAQKVEQKRFALLISSLPLSILFFALVGVESYLIASICTAALMITICYGFMVVKTYYGYSITTIWWH